MAMQWGTYTPKAGQDVPVTGSGGGTGGKSWGSYKGRDSALSGGKGGGKGAKTSTNPLDPLTAKQIVNQARKTISAAYSSSYKDLGQQGKLAAGVADKRAADDKYYQTWLDTQGQALQAHADAADVALNASMGKLGAAQSALYSGQSPALAAGANAREGNVSANANSGAFGGDLAQNQQANMGLLSNEQQFAQNSMNNNKGLVGAALANDSAYMSAIRSKQMSELDTAMTTIANSRTKLNAAKTGDIAKEITRLQGIEISKAQSNRDYAAAAQKLGLATAETQSLIANRAAGTKISAINAQTSATRALNSQMNADRNYQLNVSKYNDATAKDIYQREHNLGTYKVAKTSSTGAKPLSSTSQNVIYNRISTLGGEMNQLVAAGYSASEAYHMISRGGTYNVSGHSRTYAPGGAKDGTLNAAYNVYVQKQGLSPGDLKALQKLGLTDPGKRYGKSNKVGSTVGSVVSGVGKGILGTLGK